VTAKVLRKFKEWWAGRYVPPENDPDAPFFFVMGHMERPRLALALEAIGKWAIANYWQIIATMIGLTSIWLAYLAIQPPTR